MRRRRGAMWWSAVALVALCGCGAGPAAGGRVVRAPGPPGAVVGGSVSGVAASTPAAGPSRAHTGPTPPGVVAPAPGPAPRRVTLGDGGRTFSLRVGQTFLLALGGPPPAWTVTVANGAVLARVPNVLVVRGAQGIYRALGVGTTTLLAVSHYPCESGHPACLPADRAFRLTVRVVR